MHMDTIEKFKHQSFVPVRGDQTITPKQAARIREECYYEPQRHRTETGGVNIKIWAETISRGFWQENSQITFALCNGKFILVNGYHRIHGVLEADLPATFNVQIVSCRNMDEVASLYASFDRKGIVRSRTNEQALNAVDFAEQLLISKGVAKALFGAIPILRNNMRVPKPSDIEVRTEMALFELRIDAAKEWAQEIVLWDKIIDEARDTLKRKLLAPGVTAVGLQTIRYCGEMAVSFWTNVARNDGLRTTTPEHTLVQRLLTERFENRTNLSLLIPAIAWNAFFERRPLRMIKAWSGVDVRIAGTPVGRRGRHD